jgi:hypothetical protein
MTYKGFNHETYLFSALAGTYKIRILDSDDIVLVWLGDKAYSGYERDNADLATGTREVEITLEQGQYFPLRVLYINAQGAYRFTMEIEDPAGNIIADMTGLDSDYFVDNTCEDDNTPDFPPFQPAEQEA